MFTTVSDAPAVTARRRRLQVAVPVLGIGIVFGGWAWLRNALRYSGTLHEYQSFLIDDPGEPSQGAVRVTAMGTTMMLIDDGSDQILIDPFVTHIPGAAVLTRRKVSTDTTVVDKALERVGADRVRAVYVSHSHFDHAFDVAHVAKRTGATVHGSETTLNIARGGDVPESQLRRFDMDQGDNVGNYTIRTIRSKHSPKPLGGEGAGLNVPLRQPARVFAYPEGGTYDFLITHPAQTMLFKGSANWVPGALDGVRADTLFLASALLARQDVNFVRGYLAATIDTVEPDLVVATHWNDFFSPVQPRLPFHRAIVDQTPRSLDMLIQHTGRRSVRLGLLDAYSKVLLSRGEPSR